MNDKGQQNHLLQDIEAANSVSCFFLDDTASRIHLISYISGFIISMHSMYCRTMSIYSLEINEKYKFIMFEVIEKG